MTDDGEVLYESVFREQWRDRQSSATRPGELIKQPGWMDAGLVALGVLLVAGGVTAGTVTIARSAALPAVAEGTSVTAIRADGAPPAVGAAVQFRDPSGTTQSAVVVQVTATEVIAEFEKAGPALAGQLVIPRERQRLISVLLPRLW